MASTVSRALAPRKPSHSPYSSSFRHGRTVPPSVGGAAGTRSRPQSAPLARPSPTQPSPGGVSPVGYPIHRRPQPNPRMYSTFTSDGLFPAVLGYGDDRYPRGNNDFDRQLRSERKLASARDRACASEAERRCLIAELQQLQAALVSASDPSASALTPQPPSVLALSAPASSASQTPVRTGWKKARHGQRPCTLMRSVKPAPFMPIAPPPEVDARDVSDAAGTSADDTAMSASSMTSRDCTENTQHPPLSSTRHSSTDEERRETLLYSAKSTPPALSSPSPAARFCTTPVTIAEWVCASVHKPKLSRASPPSTPTPAPPLQQLSCAATRSGTACLPEAEVVAVDENGEAEPQSAPTPMPLRWSVVHTCRVFGHLRRSGPFALSSAAIASSAPRPVMYVKGEHAGCGVTPSGYAVRAVVSSLPQPPPSDESTRSSSVDAHRLSDERLSRVLRLTRLRHLRQSNVSISY